MKTFLQKYYDEEVYPHQKEIYSSSCYNLSVKRKQECLEALRAILDKEGIHLLNDLTDSLNLILEAVSQRNFFLGVHLGLSLFHESGQWE